MDTVEHEIGIVGLGLIGGSLALALKKAGFNNVVGVDVDDTVCQDALTAKALSKTSTDFQVLSNSSLIVLCVPLEAISDVFAKLKPILTPSTIITDVAGVKGPVIKWALSLPFPSNFIGGHPMAGREKGGFNSAIPDLFINRPWILTPTENTSDQTLEAVSEIITQTGAHVVTVPADEHDRQIAILSHLPHVLAASLMRIASKEGRYDLAGPSWEDATRVAASPSTMWTRISLTNRNELIDTIQQLEDELVYFRKALENEDTTSLQHFFEEARSIKTEKVGF